MSVRGLFRGATVKGYATPTNSPIYIDSDDNIAKIVPAGSGTTEVQLVDASSAQTLTNKTLTSPTITGMGMTFNVLALAALSTDQAGAASITATAPGLITTTTATSDAGIKLPAATPGKLFVIKNVTAASDVEVYPATGETINAIASNSPITLAGVKGAVFYCVTATAWHTIPVVPS
jgi:hypothetical protein